MKTKITALALAAVTAFSFAPKPAAASDKGLALAGGFLGGLIVGAAINDHHDRNTTVIVRDRDDRCDGYWKNVTVKVWVPGRWIVERTRYGREMRHYVEGHYEFRADRVWVAYDRRSPRVREVVVYDRGR